VRLAAADLCDGEIEVDHPRKGLIVDPVDHFKFPQFLPRSIPNRLRHKSATVLLEAQDRLARTVDPSLPVSDVEETDAGVAKGERGDLQLDLDGRFDGSIRTLLGGPNDSLDLVWNREEEIRCGSEMHHTVEVISHGA